MIRLSFVNIVFCVIIGAGLGMVFYMLASWILDIIHDARSRRAGKARNIFNDRFNQEIFLGMLYLIQKKTAVPEKPKEEQLSATDSEVQRKKDEIIKAVGEMMFEASKQDPYRIRQIYLINSKHILRINTLLSQLETAQIIEEKNKSRTPSAS